MGIIRGPTSQDDMTMNLPRDTNTDRYKKPEHTPVGGAVMTKPAFIRPAQRGMTTAAEVGRKLCDSTEPSRCQESEVEAVGAVTGAIMSIPDRCCDCGVQFTTGRKSATDGVENREPIPSQTWPVGGGGGSLLGWYENKPVPVP